MPAEFRCPTCRTRFTPPKSAVNRAECPECGELLEIDLPAEEPQPAPPKKKPTRASREDDYDDPEPDPRPRRSSRRRPAPSDGAGKLLLMLGGGVFLVAVLGGIGWAVWRFAGGGGWEFKEFSPPGGNLTVLMPGTPEKKEEENAGLRLTMYGVSRRGSGFAVGFADVRGVPVDLDGGVRGLATKSRGTAQSSGGHNAVGGWREFEIDTQEPKGYVSGRLLVARGRFYMAFAFGPDARLSNADVRRFIDSFKLTDGPAPWEDQPAPPRDNPEPPAGTQPTPKQPRITPKVNPKPQSVPPPVPPVVTRPAPGAPQPTRDEMLGNPFDPVFRDPAPAGSLLVGLDVGLMTFINYPVVGTVRPIYRAGGTDSTGKTYGKKADRGMQQVLAKPGYAIGAITARTGLGIDGFSVTFMKVKADGTLDPKDAYESEWVGNTTGGGGPRTQTGNGTPVVGLIGREGRESVSAIGLMFQGREGAGNGR